MTASDKKVYSPQEAISRIQFKELITQQGWIPDDIPTDIGEDLNVRILDKGRPTGLNFNVQIKSTPDITKITTANDTLIVNRIKVRNLKDWNVSHVPVFLVVWDINRKVGYWEYVPDLISNLNARDPNWQDRKKVTVHTPVTNQLDENGLRIIRKITADFAAPSMFEREGLSLNVTFQFPKTEDGLNKFEEVENARRTGEEVTIERKFIKDFQTSEWFTRFYGEIPIGDDFILMIGRIANPVSQFFRLAVMFEGRELQTLDVSMKATKVGSEEFTLTNEHQETPLRATLVVNQDKRSESWSFQIDPLGQDVCKYQEACKFLVALYQPNNTLRYTHVESSHVRDYETQKHSEVNLPSPSFVNVINNLCTIAEKTGNKFTIPEGFHSDEMYTIRRTSDLLINGQTKLDPNHPVVLQRLTKERLGHIIDYVKQGNAITFENKVNLVENIQGVDIPLGEVLLQMEGVPALLLDRLEAMADTMSGDDSTELELRVAEGTLTLLTS